MAINSIGGAIFSRAHSDFEQGNQLNHLSGLFAGFGGGPNTSGTDMAKLCVIPSNWYPPFLWNFDPWAPQPAVTNPGRSGISYFSSPEQDSKALGSLGMRTELAIQDGLKNLSANPQDKALRDQLFAANNQKAEQLRKFGTPVSEEQVMIWHAESLSKAAQEGRISGSTGLAAQDFLRAAHDKRQATVDISLKNGQSVVRELQPYVFTSKFHDSYLSYPS